MIPLDRRLLAPKLVYFGWFAAIGAYMPFISLYYRQAGLDLGQIGLLAALAGAVQLVAAPLWGVLADALRLRRALLPIAMAATVPPALLIASSRGFGPLFALALAQAFFTAPVVALADSATMALLGDQRERYGTQRVWGGVGWSISAVCFGWLSQRVGYSAVFVGYAALALLTAAAALALPRTELVSVDLRSAARALAGDRRWAGFLGAVFLIGCCGAVINGFLSLFLSDLGAGGAAIGLAYTIASLSELPVMALSPLVLRRWGARPLLVVAGLLYALRMGIYIIAPSAAWALAAQALHGLCFGALWTAGVVEAQRLAPPGLESTAQSLFGIAVFGVAGALASALGGQIYRDFGADTLFAIVGAAALLGALGLLLGWRAGQQADRPAPSAHTRG
jgi:PPP family 3-phenylpropionic acid transporter